MNRALKHRQRGLSFLNRNSAQWQQAPQSYISKTMDMQSPVEEPGQLFPDLETFPTECFTSIVLSDVLSQVDAVTSEKLARLACQTKKPDNTFNFFLESGLLPADVDCTALGLSVLLDNGLVQPSALASCIRKIVNNVSDDGVLLVYLPPFGHRRYTELVVCLNAMYLLLLLGMENEANKTTRYILSEFAQGELPGTRYYPSPDCSLYAASRIVSRFPDYAPDLDQLLRRQVKDRVGKSKTALDQAMWLIAAKACGFESTAAEDNLAAFQHNDGSWPASAFFQFGTRSGYFGSREISTAFAVRALQSRSNH